MGYNDQPEINSYWSTSSDLGSRAIRDGMSRRRFLQIWKYIRYGPQQSLATANETTVASQKEAEKRDAIFKVRPLMNIINGQFRRNRNPGEMLCIDESMTAFKGRSRIKVCQPRKPIKWGFENFTLCDAKNGYILNDEAHVGPGQFTCDDEPKPSFKGNLMGRTTLFTSRHYLGHGHTIVSDNRFTSAKLYEYLYKFHNTYAVGSLRGNAAEMPPGFGELRKFTGTERGDFTFRQNGRLLLTVWHDTTTVSLLSTNCDPMDSEKQVMRWVKTEGRKRQVRCPPAAYSYIKSFNGVDVSNHLTSSFRIGRRSKSWHRYFFFHKLNQLCVNARINMMEVCGITNANKRSQLNYRRSLASQMLLQYKVHEAAAAAREEEAPPAVVPGIPAAHNLTRADMGRRCTVCYRYRHERHESRWWCSSCKTNLCRPQLRNCFQLHKEGVDAVF
jgi:hypothetical protein